MMNFFDKLNDSIRDTESSVVNLVSAVAPWLAPLAPAYMTFQHAVGVLNFPLWIAWPIAIVVEIMGFSALSTFMEFWFFNRRNPAGYKKAPIEAVVGAFAVYLLTIVSSNVLLDAFDNSKPIVITVRAMLAIQTVPAAVIVIVRAGHREMLKEAERARLAASEEKQKAKLEKLAAELAKPAEKPIEPAIEPAKASFVCNVAGCKAKPFGSQAALNAHQRKHKQIVGYVASFEPVTKGQAAK
jgi:hypothetical protein